MVHTRHVYHFHIYFIIIFSQNTNEENGVFDIETTFVTHIDGLMQKKRNSIANAMELRIFCIKQSICGHCI